jgi:tetratricopeptide (TPR) repeat protein
MKGDFIAAETSYRKAIELKISEARWGYVSIGLHYGAVGHLERSKAFYAKAFANDPYNTVRTGFTVASYGILDDVEGAEAEYKRGKAWFGNDWFIGDTFITIIRSGTGRKLSPDDVAIIDPFYKNAFSSDKSPEEELAELHQFYNDTKTTAETMQLLGLSILSASRGHPDFALDMLEKVSELDSVNIWMVWLPVMKEIRRLPGFKEYVRDIGLVDFWEKFGWPDLCHPTGDGDFVCN